MAHYIHVMNFVSAKKKTNFVLFNIWILYLKVLYSDYLQPAYVFDKWNYFE